MIDDSEQDRQNRRQLDAELKDETCDACGGRFDTTSDPRVEAETDSQIADDEFMPSGDDPFDATTCAIDGWMKIEHDLGRNLVVHESCFLDHDDILVRV